MSKSAFKTDQMEPEPQPSTQVAKISERAMPSIVIGDAEFTPLSRVTIPILSNRLPNNPDVAVMFDGPFMADMSKDEDGKDRVVHVARVIDLTDGVVKRYVGGVIVVRELQALEGGYVGRKFAIRKYGPKDGKRYNQVEIFEIS